jgi:tetratricopeptide (TPR) repeat protein
MVTIPRAKSGLLLPGILVLALLLGGLKFVRAADTNASNTISNDDKTTDAAIVTSQESLRSYLQIQEQLHNTQAAIEKNRQEAQQAAVSNEQIMEGRLSRIEKAVATERLNELKDIESSQHTMLMAAGAFTVVGFLVLLVAASLQWTAVNRLTAAAMRLPLAREPGDLNGSGNELLMSQAVEQSTARFLGVIERLEQRMHQLESVMMSRKQLPANGTDGDHEENGSFEFLDQTPSLFAAGSTSPVVMLLGKGQSLLKLDKSEEALDCFDQALALDPANTEALIKKGAALERLQRLSEAIECYNRAITHDNTLTMAYLYKGAVFNRMERYGEALECYEQAMKTRQKSHAANVIFE